MAHLVVLVAVFLAPFASARSVTSLSVQELRAFNASVHGRLFRGVPFARPCFQDVSSDVAGFLDNSQCAVVQSGYAGGNGTIRAGSPGATMQTHWETCQTTSEQCLLDSTNPTNLVAFAPPAQCHQGSVMPYFVNVQEASDVIQAFRLANKTGIAVTVKNTGHDFQGRSMLKDSLGLWIANLKNLQYVRNFVPEGCPRSDALPAAVVGAGVEWVQMYQLAEANNVTLPGGSFRNVGAVGGYLQSGGHSALSNLFGLGVDRVLEFEVITPTGLHLRANACKNQDLFFALRGGGGGTFGVILSAVYKALPRVTVQSFNATFPTPNQDVRRKFFEFYIDNVVRYVNAGFGGYITSLSTTHVVLLNANATASEATSLLAPLRSFITTELNGTWTFQTETSYLGMYNDFVATRPQSIGGSGIIASRLIPDTLFATNETRAQLLDAVLAALNGTATNIIMSTPPYLFSRNRNNKKVIEGTSVTPAWRNAIWHSLYADGWLYNATLADKQAAYARNFQRMTQLRALTPSGGAYLAESAVHEPDYTQSFWGKNYQRLSAIKRKYDPLHLLDCWQCVGWMGTADPRYSCWI